MIRGIIDLHCSSHIGLYSMICVNLVFPIGLSHCGIVSSPTLNTFKAHLDRFWENQEVRYNWKANILYTGSRSNVELMF